MKGRQKKENKKFKIHSYSVEVGPNLLLISFAWIFFLLVPSCGRFSPLVPLGLLRPHIPVVPFVFLLSFFFFLLFCFFCFFLLLLLLLLLLVLLLLLSSLFSASLCSYCCWRPDVDGAFVKLLQIVRLGGRRPLQLQDIVADYKLFGDDTLFLPGKKNASRFFPSYHMIENSDVFLPFLLWNKYCCHHDQGSPHDICSIFFKCWKRSQFSTLSNRSMLMSRQTKTLPRGGTPPKNGRGGRKQHVQTSGARPWRWRVSRISSPSGWPNEICCRIVFFPSITTWCGFKYLYFVPYRTIQFHKYWRWVETTLPDDQWTVLDLPPHPVTVQAWLLRIPYSKCIDPGGDC